MLTICKRSRFPTVKCRFSVRYYTVPLKKLLVK